MVLYNALMAQLKNENFTDDELRNFVEEVIDDYHYENDKNDDKKTAMKHIIDDYKNYIIKYVEKNPTEEKIKEITKSFDNVDIDFFINMFETLYNAKDNLDLSINDISKILF